MRKAAVIGASTLEIDIKGGTPLSLHPTGRMLYTAVEIAKLGMPVSFVSEAARDSVGDLIVNYLSNYGIDTSCIDRFTGGHTPLDLTFQASDSDSEESKVRYREYPPEVFDAMWPRIDRNDVVVIGDYFAVAPRNVSFMREFIANARQRKCIIIYAPGFDIHAGKQLTPVKPTLLDTLEWSDLVVMTLDECATFFGKKSAEEVYRDNLSFYCRNVILLDDAPSLTFFGGSSPIKVQLADTSQVSTRPGNAAVLASLVAAIDRNGITRQDIDEGLTDDMRKAIISGAN